MNGLLDRLSKTSLWRSARAWCLCTDVPSADSGLHRWVVILTIRESKLILHFETEHFFEIGRLRSRRWARDSGLGWLEMIRAESLPKDPQGSLPSHVHYCGISEFFFNTIHFFYLATISILFFMSPASCLSLQLVAQLWQHGSAQPRMSHSLTSITP